MRQFQPSRIAIKPEWYKQIIERRLEKSGEYVYHLPHDSDKQTVIMNYQHIPVNEDSADYLIPNTNPTLYGLIDHFAIKPIVYKEGSSVRTPTGSQFEIRGLIYNVKKVDVNHRGYAQIELVQSDNCAIPRPDFDTEMDEFLCYVECSSDDT